MGKNSETMDDIIVRNPQLTPKRYQENVIKILMETITMAIKKTMNTLIGMLIIKSRNCLSVVIKTRERRLFMCKKKLI